ncbi:hypothetical protein [Streptomyces sp. NPDC059076]|uniref:hypothetical protein n=1 Tax=unclassified Streptomyces TaxID=2593676 RepID=UPI0036746175
MSPSDLLARGEVGSLSQQAESDGHPMVLRRTHASPTLGAGESMVTLARWL